MKFKNVLMEIIGFVSMLAILMILPLIKLSDIIERR